jgi:hypothetical protein
LEEAGSTAHFNKKLSLEKFWFFYLLRLGKPTSNAKPQRRQERLIFMKIRTKVFRPKYKVTAI